MALDRAAAEAFLCAAQRPDGAWGYRPDGMAFVEPTALAVIALRARPETAPVRARALDWLERLQQVDGGLPAFVGDDQASWMTALAALALVGRPAGERALDWLVRLHQAQPVFRGDVERLRWAAGIDGRQRGWPWVSGDATWVEPTAWAVLALAVGGRREAPETRAGVDFLLDRAGPDGGWNIGNPYMLNKPMQSEVPFTAKA
ncbi:MAG: terpene cyclase/mutase family protein, partial [Meiothermus silvanus]|nr:terpene cyclase/mutase family protein [Allomeiothermus silvanus]